MASPRRIKSAEKRKGRLEPVTRGYWPRIEPAAYGTSSDSLWLRPAKAAHRVPLLLPQGGGVLQRLREVGVFGQDFLH